MKRLLLMFVVLCAAAAICGGCSGSSSSTPVSPASAITATATATPTPGARTLAGTVASGQAVDGAQITVKDRTGRVVGQGTADRHGDFTIALLADASPPWLLRTDYARGVVFGVGEGTHVNVTPYSHFVLGLYYATLGTSTERAFAELSARTPIPHPRAISGVISTLTASAYPTFGVPRAFSPLRSRFHARAAGEAAADGFDRLLDSARFSASTVSVDVAGGTPLQTTVTAARTRDGVSFTCSEKRVAAATATQTLSTAQLVPTSSTSGPTLSGTVSGGPTAFGPPSLQAVSLAADGAINPSATIFSTPVAADADGSFVLQFPSSPGPVLVFASWPQDAVLSSSGEPATSDAVEPSNLAGAVIPTGILATIVLSVADAPASIAVTPFTQMGTTLALSLMRGGTAPSTAVPTAFHAVGGLFGLRTIATATPIDPTQTGSAAGASTDDVTAGLLLAGMATLAQNAGYDPYSLVMALGADASDGTFDSLDATLPGTATFSQAPSQQVTVQPAGGGTPLVLPVGTATATLSQAVQTFQTSSVNVSGGTVPATVLGALAQSSGALGATPTAYVSPYAIPFTIPMNQLTYDFATAPRNSVAAQTTLAPADWYSGASFPTGSLTWGPSPALYPPPANIPGGPTGNALVTWQQQRVMAVAQSLIGTPYQHHHIPAWDPSTIFGWPFSPASLFRNTAGLDCSDFSSFCYNYGLGIELCTGVANQATQTTIPVIPCDGCCPDAQSYAAIAVTPVPVPTPTATNYAQVIASFQMGDLLYYNSPATHVTMWVGTTTVNGATIGLIIDDFGNNPDVVDANGVSIPMGVRIRPWTPDTWYYGAFNRANRIITTALPTPP